MVCIFPCAFYKLTKSKGGLRPAFLKKKRKAKYGKARG
jgi:hypothetical protein